MRPTLSLATIYTHINIPSLFAFHRIIWYRYKKKNKTVLHRYISQRNQKDGCSVRKIVSPNASRNRSVNRCPSYAWALVSQWWKECIFGLSSTIWNQYSPTGRHFRSAMYNVYNLNTRSRDSWSYLFYFIVLFFYSTVCFVTLIDRGGVKNKLCVLRSLANTKWSFISKQNIYIG